MNAFYFLYPGDPATATGGYRYNREIMRECRLSGWEVTERPLPSGFPRPSRTDLAATAEVLRSLPDGAIVVIDGLAYGAMPEIAEANRDRLWMVPLVHLALCDEVGLAESERTKLFDSERKALRAARRIICTSPTSKRRLRAFGVADEHCFVVEPGVIRRAHTPMPARAAVHLLSIGSYTQRKGYEVLFKALASVSDRLRCAGAVWRLDCVGATGSDLALEQRLWQRATTFGGAVHLHGPTTEPTLDGFFRNADAYVSAALHETYGMALAEALAYGLPIVAAAGGAVSETVPAAAALFVPPGDVDRLAAALERIIREAPLRQRLAAAARQASERLPDWTEAARRFRETLTRL